MLVVKLEATYYKKAVGRTTFVCTDGEKLQQAVDESIATGEARTVVAKSTGTNNNGELVAEFFVTWSFKSK